MQSRRHYVQDFSFTSTASYQPADSSGAGLGGDMSFSDLSTVAAHHDARNRSITSMNAASGSSRVINILPQAESGLSSDSNGSVVEVNVDNDWASLRYDESSLTLGNIGGGDMFTDVHTTSPQGPSSSGEDSHVQDESSSAGYEPLHAVFQSSSSSDESVGQLVKRIQEKTHMRTGRRLTSSEYSSPSSGWLLRPL